MSDEVEDIPGLPGELPPGERLLWQGRPDWRSLARHHFKAGWLTVYLGALVALRLVVGLQRGEGVEAFTASGIALAASSGALGVVVLIAWLYARGTIYSLTSHRLVMRIGIAIPITVNLPFRRLATADLSMRDEKTGDIVLQLAGADRLAWLHLWPHVQPRHFAHARPTLLTLAKPKEVAAMLASAVEQWSATSGAAVLVAEAPRTESVVTAPVSGQLAAEH